MKSKEELDALRERMMELQKDLTALTPEELAEVIGISKEEIMNLNSEALEKIASGQLYSNINGDPLGSTGTVTLAGIVFVPVTFFVNANALANVNANMNVNANTTANVNVGVNVNAGANYNTGANWSD